MQDKLIDLKNEVLSMIAGVESLKELENLRIVYLGKSNGKLTNIMKKIPELPENERGVVGKFANEVKNTVEEALNTHKRHLLNREIEEENSNIVDVSLLGTAVRFGRLHPTTIVFREMNEIFASMGFSVAEGPEIESDEFNYNRLNLPADHPARDLQDTIYIREPDLLLRTHTSSIESRILANIKPPFRFIIPGKCYRFENVNATNNVMFTQYEGIAVGENISLADLKGTLETFTKRFFGQDRETRFRCKYYPQVEPGVGVDLSCQFCQKKGCSVCKYRGWIEMLGAGMVHPNMLKIAGLDPNKYSGFAWGMGSDRIVMDRYKIKDIRALYSGEISFKE